MKKYLHHKYHHHHLFGLFLLVALASLSLLSTQIKTPEKHVFLIFGVTGQVIIDDKGSSEILIDDLDVDTKSKDSQETDSGNVKIVDFDFKAGGEEINIEKIIPVSDNTVPGLINFIINTRNTINTPYNALELKSITFTVRASVKSVEEKKQQDSSETFLFIDQPVPSVPEPTTPSYPQTPSSTTYNDYSETGVQRTTVTEELKRYNTCPESNNPQMQKAMKLVPGFVKTDSDNIVRTTAVCAPNFNIQNHIQSFCSQFKVSEDCPQQWLYQDCLARYKSEAGSLETIKTKLCTLSGDGRTPCADFGNSLLLIKTLDGQLHQVSGALNIGAQKAYIIFANIANANFYNDKGVKIIVNGVVKATDSNENVKGAWSRLDDLKAGKNQLGIGYNFQNKFLPCKMISFDVTGTATGTQPTSSTGTCPQGKVKSGNECVCYTGVEQPDGTCSQVSTGTGSTTTSSISARSITLSPPNPTSGQGVHIIVEFTADVAGRQTTFELNGRQKTITNVVGNTGYDKFHFSADSPGPLIEGINNIKIYLDGQLVGQKTFSPGSTSTSSSTTQDPCAEKGGVYDASLGGCKCTTQKPVLSESGCKTCQEACSAEGLLTSQPNYMPFVQSKLNSAEGYCKKSAHIDYPPFKEFFDHTEKKICTCYKNENPVVTISPELLVCTGTPCGNVPCDKQVTSGTTTCYCKFSGWECSQASCSSSAGASQEYASNTPPSGGTGSGGSTGTGGQGGESLPG